MSILNKNTVQCANVSIKRGRLPKCWLYACIYTLPGKGKMYLYWECWIQFLPSPPDSVWGQQHQTAPTESTCSLPQDHQQLHLAWQQSLTLRVCSPVGCHSRAEAAAQRNPNSVLPGEGIINLPAESINAWCLLPKTWKATATSMLTCTGTPQAT